MLTKQKYRLLFSLDRVRRPGPKGPTKELIDAVVEMKRRNRTWGCKRITQQIASPAPKRTGTLSHSVSSLCGEPRVVNLQFFGTLFSVRSASMSENSDDVPGLDERLLVHSCADALESFNLRIPRKGDMTNE